MFKKLSPAKKFFFILGAIAGIGCLMIGMAINWQTGLGIFAIAVAILVPTSKSR